MKTVEDKKTPPTLGANNLNVRPEPREASDTRLPSERFFSQTQSDRMRAAADRHFSAQEVN